MSAHSPFPWTRNPKGMRELRDANGEGVVFAGLSSAGGDRADLSAANTALVEAIPEMLDALQHVQSALRGNVPPEMREVIRKMVETAIEKATR